MDFGALPPEINSGRMYSGPGCGSMLAAAAAWDELAADLRSTAVSYQWVIGDLTGGPWLGPASVAMTATVTPYIEWMTTTAALCEQTASNARAAAAAYEAAFAMTVPPAMIAANRVQLMALIATNFLGQNTAAIAATEAHYAEMWAQDAGAMYEYAAASAAAAALPPFTSPPPTTNPAGLAGQVAAVAQASATSAGTGTQTIMSTGSTVISAIANAPQGLALPATAQLLSLLSPVNLAVASSSTAITSTGTAGSYGGLAYAVHYDPEGASRMDAILERLAAVPGGTGTGTLASMGSADLGAGGGAATELSGALGRASSIGALSVPPSWAATTPPIRLVAAAWPNTLPSAIPTGLAAGPENLFNEMFLASMAVRGIGGAAPQGRPTSTITVTPRSRESDNWRSPG